MMLLMTRFIFLEATPWWSVLAEHPKRGPTPTQIWLWNLERKEKGFHSLCVWQRHPWKRSRRWLFIWELKHLTLIHLRLPLVFPSAPSSSLSPPLLFFFFFWPPSPPLARDLSLSATWTIWTEYPRPPTSQLNRTSWGLVSKPRASWRRTSRSRICTSSENLSLM